MMRYALALLLMMAVPGVFAQGDDCTGAVSITPTLTNCNFQAGSSANATQSLPSCSGGGVADDDVWYAFVANSTNMTITVDPTVGYDAVIELFSGTCGSLASLQCEDVNGANGDEVLNINTLSVGVTYYFRVFHYGVGSGTSTFNVCVTGLAPPTNNTPCNAYPLPTVDPSCNFDTYTNLGSAGSAVATPSACGGSSPFQGGYAGGDVWFSVVVPASGELDIHTLAIDFADGAMALYTGPCTAPTLLECDDDGEPGDGILMPHIYYTGLTPGATVYIRVWEYGNNNNGQFGICVSTPDNDDCNTAQQICDLNGYGGITSSAYTIDQPSNMCGIGNPLSPNPGCVFGTGYTGTSPVQIDNNSWLQFTASSTTATLFVQVNQCSNGNGMQMQIFSGTNCTNFSAVSPFLETLTSQSITATGLTPGNTYYIVIDGFAGDICSYTISATSGVQVVEAVTSKSAICKGDSAVISALVTGTGSYTYTWSSTPPGLFSTDSSLTVSPTQNTLYTVDITGLCGSVTTASVYVTAHDLPTAGITASDTVICQDELVNLNGNPAGGTSPYQHTWTGSGIPFLNNAGLITPVFSGTTPGSYTLYYDVTDTIGCAAQDSVDILVNANPSAAIIGIDSICLGDTTILNATGGGTYAWNIGGNADSIVVSPSTNTSYQVVVTNANNCTDTANFSLTVNPVPTASVSGNNVICQGNSTTLTAAGGSTFLWNTGSSSASISVSPTADTTYVVTVTNSSGCSDTASYLVQVLSNPTASIAAVDSICLGSSIALTASGGGTYQWNNGQTSPTINMSPQADTTYTVIVDVGGCKDTTSHLVTVNPLPVVSISGNTTICNGQATTLLATGGGGYTWNTGGILDSITVNPTSTTTYTVVVTDANSCVDSSSITVLVNPLPVISINGTDSICLGNTSTLVAGGALQYNWNTGDTTGSIVVNPGNTTSYTVIGTDVNGCVDSTQFTVFIKPNPTASISGTSTICDGESTQLLASGGGAYFWSTGDTTSAINVMPGDTTTYTVIVNDNGCADTATYTVVVIPLPGITAYSDTTIILGQSAQIYASGGSTFFWTPTDSLSCTTCADPLANPTETTTYCARTSQNGCENESCVTVYVDVLCGEIFVPNAFSPNGDGSNDCLKVYSNCLAEVLFRVYSRWGELLYESNDVDGCWDGTKNGQDLNTGVYTYTVQAKLIDGQEIEQKGNTTLFK
ncbi:MAG: gliding motility-associated C-terminal domain-containing protein [Flavobacteriales bacterium]|nr:gliding motility-associated C-terminal domain-containing protein [Flavobacteriales bacterium]